MSFFDEFTFTKNNINSNLWDRQFQFVACCASIESRVLQFLCSYFLWSEQSERTQWTMNGRIAHKDRNTQTHTWFLWDLLQRDNDGKSYCTVFPDWLEELWETFYSIFNNFVMLFWTCLFNEKISLFFGRKIPFQREETMIAQHFAKAW